MRKVILVLIFNLIFSFSFAKDLKKCEWKNESGIPCLTIFSAPNTSKINESGINKTVITKKQMIDSGYEDVRSLLEHVMGVDVYSDGPRGQKTSVFMRGTNSNHTLVLLNGILLTIKVHLKRCSTLVMIFYKVYSKLKYTKEQVEQYLVRQQ